MWGHGINERLKRLAAMVKAVSREADSLAEAMRVERGAVGHLGDVRDRLAAVVADLLFEINDPDHEDVTGERLALRAQIARVSLRAAVASHLNLWDSGAMSSGSFELVRSALIADVDAERAAAVAMMSPDTTGPAGSGTNEGACK